jgi:putative ABC transport system permease protein
MAGGSSRHPWNVAHPAVPLLLALLMAVVTAGAVLSQSAATPVTTAAAPQPILVARQLAESEGLQVGQVVRLSTRASGADPIAFRIDGIFEPTPDPARLGQVPRVVRLHLPDLLALTEEPGEPRSAEAVTVGLRDPAGAASFARDLATRVPGISVGSTSDPEDAGPFRVLQRFHLAIAIVTIIAATVFLLALTIMLVDERRATVGVLRLIGLPVQRILVQLFIEGVLIAGLGAVIGLAMAVGSERLINTFFQWRYDTALLFVRITPEVAARCVAIAVPLGVTATVVASWALLRRNGLALARR